MVKSTLNSSTISFCIFVVTFPLLAITHQTTGTTTITESCRHTMWAEAYPNQILVPTNWSIVHPNQLLVPTKSNSDNREIMSINVDKTFKVYDKDHNDFLSVNEFDLFCNSHPSCPANIFSLADANDDGKVTYMEMTWMATYVEVVIQNFKKDDKNGDGFVTGNEINCDWCINDYDTDGDGKFNIKEYIFLDFVLNIYWTFEETLSNTSPKR